MIDEESIEIAFTSLKLNVRPENASPTVISENYESISGWLRRKPVQGVKTWEWKYFTLKDCKLKRYSKEDQLTPDGVFNFNQLTAAISSLKSRSFYIEFHSCRFRFYFKAETKEERQQWLTALSLNIITSVGSNKILSTVASKDNFWKYEKVSNYWFQSNANTGDVLLFQSKAMGAKIQRGIAGSSFDHTAMLLCYSSGKISVLEATAFNGVWLVDWGQFLNENWISCYTKIVYRKLEVERSESFLNDLSNFIKNVQGKSFGFSAKKMIMKNNKKAGTEEDFFCSELVASAYKSVGILSSKCNTSGIWPADFEKDKALPFVGASLGPLIEIDFDI